MPSPKSQNHEVPCIEDALMKVIFWPVQAFVLDTVKSAVNGPMLIPVLAVLLQPFESITVKVAVVTSCGYTCVGFTLVEVLEASSCQK